MSKRFFYLRLFAYCSFAAYLSLVILPAHTSAAETAQEQLIVFVQPGLSEVDDTFQRDQLPDIRDIANGMGVSLNLVDARNGAPPEIAITPLIVYQNHRGRSIYQGRTTTPTRIRNFIRTSRYVPQGEESNSREKIPIWVIGRERIWAPLKISAVTGTPPDGYDHQAFLVEALTAIESGFRHFRFEDRAELGRADRGFYMDFYPWRSQDGTLFLSLALYSQFHCKDPIFEKKKPALIGPWKDRRSLFRQAAALMETEVAAQIKKPSTGDAFDPVGKETKTVSWEALGFGLPPAPPEKSSSLTVDTRLPRKWILEKPAPLDPPMIHFRFPAPLDQYAGEVTDASGEFELPADLALEGMTGHIKIDTRSAITMGEPVLDEAIRGSALLATRDFPGASFVAKTINGDGQPIAFGRLTPADIAGTFELKGKKVPLAVVGEIEPVVGEDAQPRLLIRTSFRIDLRTFEIEGADGPAPARHTLLFDVSLRLKPMRSGNLSVSGPQPRPPAQEAATPN